MGKFGLPTFQPSLHHLDAPMTNTNYLTAMGIDTINMETINLDGATRTKISRLDAYLKLLFTSNDVSMTKGKARIFDKLSKQDMELFCRAQLCRLKDVTFTS